MTRREDITYNGRPINKMTKAELIEMVQAFVEGRLEIRFRNSVNGCSEPIFARTTTASNRVSLT